METKPNDYAYSSNASPSLPPPSSARIATRIELIRGAKLNTRILIITRGGGGGPTKISSRELSSPLLHFLPAEKYFYPPPTTNELSQHR